MMIYLKYFKVRLVANLQYRTAALAGISTQFFWGIMNILIYQAFYNNTNTSMTLESLITYVWLNQAFMGLIYFFSVDKDMIRQIKNGDIAYEIVRPYNPYLWWFFKSLATKYATTLLRFSPIIIIPLFLPHPFNLALPYSAFNFILFVICLFLGSLIVTAIHLIIQAFAFYTVNDEGVSRLIIIIAEFLSGFIIPIPLFPIWLQNLVYFLPFRLVGDLSFRVYSNNITVNEALLNISFQVIWISILVFIGYKITTKALNKMHIQGG